MILLAIDPGPEQSAYVLYDTEAKRPVAWAKVPNFDLLFGIANVTADELSIEMIASYGMAVGAEVFETCVWIGRFIERWYARGLRYYDHRLVYRRDVKLHLTGSPRANDANVRQALIDRFGPGKEKAIGKKASPGPLYGIKSDVWAALAVAITAAETVAS